MMKTALLPVAAAMLAVSCYVFDTASRGWLELSVGRPDIFEVEWPRESGEYVAVNELLTDSAGFAGIEVEVNVPGESPRILTATDLIEQRLNFKHRPNYTGHRIKVPEEGTAYVYVKLYQHGELVAKGRISWPLDLPALEWNLHVERSIAASSVAFYENEARCVYPWCYRIERIEIDEAARNYPDEALWLVLDRHIGAG